MEDQIVSRIEKFNNEYIAYPNPSRGDVNLMLFSVEDTEAKVTLTDLTGKIIYKGSAMLITGKNELEFKFKGLKTGIYILKVASKQNDYGTSKIIFR